MSYRCFHRGTAKTCGSGYECPWATDYYRRLALRYQNLLKRIHKESKTGNELIHEISRIEKDEEISYSSVSETPRYQFKYFNCSECGEEIKVLSRYRNTKCTSCKLARSKATRKAQKKKAQAKKWNGEEAPQPTPDETT